MKVKISDIAWLNKTSFDFSNHDTVKYIDTSSVTEGTFLGVQEFNTQSDSIPSRARRGITANTIILSTVRPNLKHYGIVDFPCNDTVVSTGFVTIDVKPEKVDALFLYYIISSPFVTNYLVSIATTAVSSYPSFNPDDLGQLEIEVPTSLEEQRKIAKVLNALDRKAKNNISICSDLEAMAKLLYDYWFVQFDFPDENGKPYKSSGGKMVWNEQLKREIPEVWIVSNLEPFIKVIRGVSYNPDMISETPQAGYVPLVKSNNVHNDRLLLDDVIYVPQSIVSNDQYLTDNSIFVTMSSGSTEHVGKTAIISFDTPYCFGAFCSKIIVNPEYRCFVSMFFLSEYFKKRIRSIIVGTSIKNINNNHLIDNVIAIPPEHILKRFESIINPLFDKQGSIIQENQQLKSLRDFLLPMLMNGQVKIGE